MTEERRAHEAEGHECSVCTTDLDLEALEHDVLVAASAPAPERAAALAGAAMLNGETGGARDEIPTEGDAALRQALADAAQGSERVAARLRELEGERAEAANLTRVGVEVAGLLERRRAAELAIARSQGALEALQPSLSPEQEAERAALELRRKVLKAAEAVTTELVRDAQRDVLTSLSQNIADLARDFGIPQLTSVELGGGATLKVHKGRVYTPYGKCTPGEQLRLKVATAVALLTVSPSEDLSAAALQACFAPDKGDMVTVRVSNNRTFTQVMSMFEGGEKWAWTWPGDADYSIVGDVYLIAHQVFDSPTSFLLPPLHAEAVGVGRPASAGTNVIGATTTVDWRTFLIDVTSFLADQTAIGGTASPVLDAFLQAFYECGGKNILSRSVPNGAADLLRVAVQAAASCAEEMLRNDSEFGKRFEDPSRSLIASNRKPLDADAVVQANRAVRRLAGIAQILMFGQVAFYVSDQLANAMVGPLTWTIRGFGRPEALGQWKPTCSDLASDADALYRNLALQDQFGDTSKELWQFPGWQPSAAKAIAPLGSCLAAYRISLASYLPTKWGDPKSATVVSDLIRNLGAAPETVTVTPFFSDGRVRLPVETGGGFYGSVNCFPSSVTLAPNLYQCGSTAAHLPVCWRDGLDFYCMHGPDDTTVARVYASDVPTWAKPEFTHPWQITLSDGSKCDVRLGGAWSKPPDGYGYTYECGGTFAALLAPLQGDNERRTVDSTTWTVHAQKDFNGPVIVVGVKQIVYAGATPTAPKAQTGNPCPTAAVLQAALKAGQNILPQASGGIRCVEGWASSAYDDGNNAYPGAFHQQGSQWVRQDLDTVCPLPSPIPADLYNGICRVS